MRTQRVPYRKTVFVCTNVRENGKIACANPGRDGQILCDRLKEFVKQAGLKDKARVVRAGCLDLCAQGPNIMIYPEGEWLSDVSQKDLPEIIKKIATDI